MVHPVLLVFGDFLYQLSKHHEEHEGHEEK